MLENIKGLPRAVLFFVRYKALSLVCVLLITRSLKYRIFLLSF